MPTFGSRISQHQPIHTLNIVNVPAVTRAFRKQKIANPMQVACDGIEALEMLRVQAGQMVEPCVISVQCPPEIATGNRHARARPWLGSATEEV